MVDTADKFVWTDRREVVISRLPKPVEPLRRPTDEQAKEDARKAKQ